MAESKKSPVLRFKGFTDAWEQRKLENLTNDIGTGKSKYIKREKSEENCYPILGSTSIISYDNSFDYQGDFILTARVGANAGNLYSYSGQAKITDNTVYIKSENNLFLFALLSNYDLRKLSFGTGQPLIKASELKKLNLSVPIQEEQKKIANIMQEMSDLIAHHQRKLDLLINLRRSLSQNMFPQKEKTTPNIRFIGFTDNWVQHQLGNIGDTYSGLSGKTKKDFGHGEAEYVTYMNVFTNPVSNPEMTEHTEIDTSQNLVKRGDVFFTVSSETPEEVGMSSVWLSDKANVYLNSFCFGFRPTLEINSYFLSEILRAQNIRSKMMVLAQGISRFNISKNKVMKLSISLPTTPEQEKIGKLFKMINDDLLYYQRKLESFKQLKQALLQKMFV